MLLPPSTSCISNLTLIQLLPLHLPLLRIAPCNLPTEVLQTNLNGAHILNELVKSRHVQLSRKVDFIWNFFYLGQVGVHKARPFQILVVCSEESGEGNIVLLNNLVLNGVNSISKMRHSTLNQPC